MTFVINLMYMLMSWYQLHFSATANTAVSIDIVHEETLALFTKATG
jgi:hypothetical protein